MTNRNSALDPRQFITTKPLPVSKACDGKLARGSTACSARHSNRQQLSLTRRQGYMSASWRRPPAPREEEVGQPRYLEPKRQLAQEESLEKAERAEPLQSLHNEPPHSTTGSKASTREDSMSLRKHLNHARRLASAVKQGRGYFHLLQKEEEEKEEEEARQRRRREEQLRAPPRVSSDSSHSDSDGCPLPDGSSTWARPRRKKKAQWLRPFTPVHRSLTSPLVSEAPTEAIYRQLCCLNWLLEALTLEHSGRAGPISSCWDYKDPGRGRTTLKTFNRERAIQSRWERFVCMPQPRRTGLRPPLGGGCSSSNMLRRSTSSTLTSSSVLGSSSLSSLGPAAGGSEEEEGGMGGTSTCSTRSTPAAGLLWGVSDHHHRTESPAGGAPQNMPASEYPLLDEVLQRVRRELYGAYSSTTSSLTHSLAAPRPQPRPQRQRLPHSLDKASRFRLAERSRPKSCPVRSAASGPVGSSKASAMLMEMRAALEQRAEERAQSYTDVLELNARNRLHSGLQRFRALRHVTAARRGRLPCHMTSVADTTHPGPGGGGGAHVATATPTSDNNNNNTSNRIPWLAALLNGLPEEVRRERAVSRVLGKLSGVAGERVLSTRVRPQLFFKVLGALQPWELCLPDLCVAIEIAREHVVQMPREDYDAWLCSRVSLPSQDPHQGHHAPQDTR